MGLRRPSLDARYAKYLDRLDTGVSFQETGKPLEPCKVRLCLRSNSEDFIQLPFDGLPIALFHGIAQSALHMKEHLPFPAAPIEQGTATCNRSQHYSTDD